MTNEVSVVNMLPADLAAPWGREVQNLLHSEENVLATLEVDLNQTLQFVRGLVVVTNRRLLCRVGPQSKWQHWDYRADLVLRHHDHAGVGHLRLQDDTGLLASWCFTLGQNLHAIRLVDQFQAQQEFKVSGKPLAAVLGNVCPSCKAPLEPDQEECPICTKVLYTPPSTWTLFRL